MSISAIVPVWNGRALLERMLDTLEDVPKTEKPVRVAARQEAVSRLVPPIPWARPDMGGFQHRQGSFVRHGQRSAAAVLPRPTLSDL